MSAKDSTKHWTDFYENPDKGAELELGQNFNYFLVIWEQKWEGTHMLELSCKSSSNMLQKCF